MKAYRNKSTAIIGLHENGFTEDFVYSGNNLLWVQQNLILLPGDITPVEFYCFGNRSEDEMYIFGIIANHYCARGILITHPKISDGASLPVINGDLIKTNLIQLENNYAGICKIHFSI